MVRVCLAAQDLLHLTQNVDKTYLEHFPLSLYAAQHGVHHVKFSNVESQVQDPIKHLL
jgi:hypothetical protein